MMVRTDKWKIWTNLMMNNEVMIKFTNAVELDKEFEMVNLDAVGS